MKRKSKQALFTKPTVYHAAVIIFLEFFAFGLLTAPMITVLDETFPKHTFLMNGLIQGVKGFLSFLSAPLIGALSDVFGRRPFLFLTVFFTCSPIPLMKISHWWYFTVMSISGVFAVTFSVVFAYVADVTTEEDRTYAYGLVSATFAASLVTSPAIGAYLGKVYSDNFVIALASSVALLDIFFILAFVPESLPDKCRPAALGNKFTWEKADPFRALKRMSGDHLILMLCIATFLSYLPEAGEYSCFFVYLRLVIGFTEENVAYFIAVVGILSCLSQTIGLSILMKNLGHKQTIIIGLICEMIQLALYGFTNKVWIMWLAGSIAGLGSLTYPAISAFVSNHAEADQQGVAQGLVTGIRGLCNGLGPAVFGFIFYIFQVDLNPIGALPGSGDFSANLMTKTPPGNSSVPFITHLHKLHERFIPGPPFAFGALLVLMALFVSVLIPTEPSTKFMFKDRRQRLRVPSANAVASLLASNEEEAATSSTIGVSNASFKRDSEDEQTENKRSPLLKDVDGSERRKHVKTSSASSNELLTTITQERSCLVEVTSPCQTIRNTSQPTTPGSRGVHYSRLPTNDVTDDEYEIQ